MTTKRTGVSADRRQIVYRKDGGECCYCGAKISPCNATIEHVIPLSAGGDNRSINLRLCCRPCNGSLGKMLADGELHVNQIRLSELDERQIYREIRRQFNTNRNALKRKDSTP